MRAARIEGSEDVAIVFTPKELRALKEKLLNLPSTTTDPLAITYKMKDRLDKLNAGLEDVVLHESTPRPSLVEDDEWEVVWS